MNVGAALDKVVGGPININGQSITDFAKAATQLAEHTVDVLSELGYNVGASTVCARKMRSAHDGMHAGDFAAPRCPTHSLVLLRL